MARTQERVDIRILPVAALTAKEWDGIWELTQVYVETQRPYPVLILYFETAFGRVLGAGAPMPLRRNSRSLASWLEACLRTPSTSQPLQS